MSMKPRVVFLGNGFDYSLAFLRALVASEVELVSIVAPAVGGIRKRWPLMAASWQGRLSRHRNVDPPRNSDDRYPWHAVRIANDLGIQVLWPSSIHEEGFLEDVQELRADLIVMAGFNQIFRAEELSALPPVLNVHPSLLPDFKGPNPEFWIVNSGAVQSGVTLHRVEEKIDAGAILAQRSFAVEPWLTGGDLQQRAMDLGSELLVDFFADFSAQKLEGQPQSGTGSYQGRLTEQELLAPWTKTPREVYDRARAAAPWSGLFLFVPEEWWFHRSAHGRKSRAFGEAVPGAVILQMKNAAVFEGDFGTPGTVQRSEGGGVAVSCKGGAVFFAKVEVVKL